MNSNGAELKGSCKEVECNMNLLENPGLLRHYSSVKVREICNLSMGCFL